ncbi:MAG: UDP-N-acetylglucosamine 2-epimerase (non-hydrolyzing) [Chloroflexi bacterium]|nr:UDP-N-acetylglucosamine 2-epimerase (non-hydrolyzing) [Chloroflexota bacterium]
MKIAICLGTRPEIIKMAPVIKLLEREGRDYFILHTGQHYSYELDRVFFQELALPPSRYNVGAGSGSHARQTAQILVGVEDILRQDPVDVVLAEGDTNSVLASSLAAVKMHIKTGHVEAGLRSYDRNMPEEINRIVADHCCDLLFAPTAKSVENLRAEGIPREKIFLTGNTIVDVVYQVREAAARNTQPLKNNGLRSKGYLLVTVHRQENVEIPERFAGILKALKAVSSRFQLPVFYPIHPHSRKNISAFGLESEAEGIILAGPTNYIDFVALELNAALVLTDSGGVQEETCILQVPCVTLRDNTERPETVDVGANVLAGADPARILGSAELMLKRKRDWANPFGDGTAAEKIVASLDKLKGGT